MGRREIDSGGSWGKCKIVGGGSSIGVVETLNNNVNDRPSTTSVSTHLDF